MPLTDDEYTCLLIMKDGENLIRMRETRWYAPLCSLHEKDLVKPIGNENFVITQKGSHALVEHEKGLDGALTQAVHAHVAVNNARVAMLVAMLEKMRTAVDSLSDAAEIAARTTGESRRDALRKIAHEVLERALEKIA